jgi:hypothetical protein
MRLSARGAGRLPTIRTGFTHSAARLHPMPRLLSPEPRPSIFETIANAYSDLNDSEADREASEVDRSREFRTTVEDAELPEHCERPAHERPDDRQPYPRAPPVAEAPPEGEGEERQEDQQTHSLTLRLGEVGAR